MTRIKKSAPILDLAKPIPAKHLPPKIRTAGDLQRIADRAEAVLLTVRDEILDPMPRKTPPAFPSAAVARLCGIDRERLKDLSKYRLDLPKGTSKGAGASKEYSLKDTITMVEKLANHPKRPSKNGTPVKGVSIAVANFKGGVTKTTTTMAIAQGLTLKGLKVLVVDLDPQGSATSLNGTNPTTEVEEAHTALPLFAGDETDLRSAVQESYWDNLDIVMSCPILYNAEFLLPAEQARDVEFKFWEVLRSGLKPLLEEYDVILFDTPPSLSYITINAIMAADGILVPIVPNSLDFASSTQFWRLFSDVVNGFANGKSTGAQKTFDFINIFLAKVDESHLSTRGVRNWIQTAYGDLVLPVSIPLTSVSTAASAEFGTVYDVPKYEGSRKAYARAREAYDALVDAVFEQICGVWQARLDAAPEVAQNDEGAAVSAQEVAHGAQ